MGWAARAGYGKTGQPRRDLLTKMAARNRTGRPCERVGGRWRPGEVQEPQPLEPPTPGGIRLTLPWRRR